MRLYRICRSQTIQTAFSGMGARSYPGRWNLAGTSIVYTASSRPLSILELLVHTDSDLIPMLWLYEIDVPEALQVEDLPLETLPSGWDAVPPIYATQALGTQWVDRQSSCILRVPSVVSPGDANYLLNVNHTRFGLLGISGPAVFRFDPRLHS